MISTETKFQTQKKHILREVSRLREELEDLMDYLDLIEARARNKGKPQYTTAEVRKKLGLS
jgi:cell division protein FtsB